jgi:hypothetical protein
MEARRAAIELSYTSRGDDESHSVRLLRDIRGIFDGRGVERITSTALIEDLHDIEESPWSEWHGKPLSVRGLAKLRERDTLTSRRHRDTST